MNNNIMKNQSEAGELNPSVTINPSVTVKNHIEKSRRLLNEISDTGGDIGNSKAKFQKIIYELDTARDAVQSIITQIDEEAVENELADIFRSSASGTVGIIGGCSNPDRAPDWLQMRLETTLPSNKNLAEVKRLSNTVTNLLDCYAGYLGHLPQYGRVFVAIVEHICPNDDSDGKSASYDHDNKGYRAIPNALKGRLFADDNQFTMSLGLFTVENPNDPHCDVYIIPIEDIAEFTAQNLVFELQNPVAVMQENTWLSADFLSKTATRYKFADNANL